MEPCLPATLTVLSWALPEPGNQKLPRTATPTHHTLLMLSSGLVLTWLSRVGCSAHQTNSWPEKAVCQWGPPGHEGRDGGQLCPGSRWYREQPSQDGGWQQEGF